MKNKIIEQMAKIMCGHDCEECAKETAEWRGVSFEKAKAEQCLIKKQAELLYNAGYCKANKDECEYWKSRCKEIGDVAYEKARKEIKEQAIKDFAKDIKKLEEMNALGLTGDYLFIMKAYIDDLAKQFGVDLKGEE